jgi:serine/threonine protein kinase
MYKFYKLGDLNNFIWQNDKKMNLVYTFGAVFSLGKRIAWSLNMMQKKGFVHDDIKPKNILQDSDDEECFCCGCCSYGQVAQNLEQLFNNNKISTTYRKDSF